MRFALVATVAAAAVAVPLAVSASGPQMSSEQFLAAVRCTAYEDIAHPGDQLAEAKWRLNAEARRQPLATAALAEAEVSSIARQAASEDAAELDKRYAAACAGPQLARGADSHTGA
jgi:hypothetical protein